MNPIPSRSRTEMRCLALFAPVLLVAAEGAPFPNQMDIGLHAYEPIYFAFDPGIGDAPLSAKFQVSLAVRLFEAQREDGDQDGLYLAYSQTSLWDLQSESKPFFDSSYRPEAWWHIGLPDRGGTTGLGLQPGAGHESNGRGGADSRSLNHVFLRAVGEWRSEGLALFAMPRARIYLDTEDNPDIAEYRGYVDLTGGMRIEDGFGLTASFRIGEGADRGSAQFDATYPLAAIFGSRVRGFLYAQWFAGWSETLLAYDEKSEQPRVLVGYSIVR